MEPGEFLFGTGADASQVSAVLSERYSVHVEPGLVQQVTFVDTADWRLYQRGLCLRDAREQRGGRLRLTDRAAVLATAPSPQGSWPRLISALPPSPVRERIAPAVGIRALLPLARVGVHSLTFRLLDAERKTRVRVRVDQERLVGAHPAPLPLRVLISPLRGYERDARRAGDLLAESLPPGPEGLDGATVAALAAGLRPGQAPIAPLLLDPLAPAVVSTATALRHWLEVAVAARGGVLDDIDTEFLRELRSAMRATRSLLAHNADTLPAESTAHFAEEFAWLGRLTAPLRDLDVTLLELAGFGELEVGDLELTAMRTALTRRRRAALRTVREQLGSSRATTLDTQWRDTLQRWTLAPVAGLRTADLAVAEAARGYERLVSMAGPLGVAAEPDDLHHFQDHCRQLAFVLETFESLFDPTAVGSVLACLHQLLDSLVSIAHCTLVRTQVGDVAAQLERRASSGPTLLSLGALRERALVRDRDARAQLERHLTRLRSDRIRAQVAALTPASAPPTTDPAAPDVPTAMPS